MYFVYVLHSIKDNGFYIGFADDLEQRLRKRFAGSVLSTKGRRPLKLIFYEAYINRNDAQRRTMLREYLEYAKQVQVGEPSR